MSNCSCKDEGSCGVQSQAVMEERMEPIIRGFEGKKGIAIPLLASIQREFGFVKEEALRYAARKLDIAPSELFGVASFYAMFRFQPEGKYVIRICRGTACHVQGSKGIADDLSLALKVKDGETTSDGLFTLQHVACLGCCSLAPVMMVGNDVHGLLTGVKALEILEGYRAKE